MQYIFRSTRLKCEERFFLTKTFIKHQNSCPNTGLVISQAIIKGDKNFFPLLSEVKRKEILEAALNAYFHPFPIGFFFTVTNI